MGPRIGKPQKGWPVLKYICLIRDEPPLRYFVNKLAQVHKPELVVVEQPSRNHMSPTEKLKTLGVQGTIKRIFSKIMGDPDRQRKTRTLTELFEEISKINNLETAKDDKSDKLKKMLSRRNEAIKSTEENGKSTTESKSESSSEEPSEPSTK